MAESSGSSSSQPQAGAGFSSWLKAHHDRWTSADATMPSSISKSDIPIFADTEMEDVAEHLVDSNPISVSVPDYPPSSGAAELQASHAASIDVAQEMDKDEVDTEVPHLSQVESLTPPASPSAEMQPQPLTPPQPPQLVPPQISDENQPVVLEPLWRIDIDEDLPVSATWKAVPQTTSQPDISPSWRCAVMKTVAVNESTPAGKVWKRWAQKLEELAAHHVSEAFGQISPDLRAVTQSAVSSCDGDMHTVLALAGSDVSDHEATMHQAEGLVRAECPKACIARVAPENFRSLKAVIRDICEQIMTGGDRTPSSSNVQKLLDVENSRALGMEAGETELGEGEESWPEDLERQQAQKAGLNDCVDWYQEQQSRNAVGGIVLLVERVEAVPKDILRDAFTAVGIAFGCQGIPVFVILGLQHLPQDCFDLFEGKPLASMRMIGATRLFDSRVICNQLLEWLLEDSTCMLVLPPNILDWLRRGRFEYTIQSVSHVMKFLALLCIHFFSESPCGLLCTPLENIELSGIWDLAAAATSELSKETLEPFWTKIFEARLQQCPELIEHLKEMWAPWWNDRAEDDKGSQALVSEVAQAAAQGACWRQRLTASFGVWDALVCAMQPGTRHEARLRRLCKLTEHLWPSASSYDAASLAAASKLEQEKFSKAVGKCIDSLSKDDKHSLSDEDVLKLLRNFVQASANLDDGLKSQITGLETKTAKLPCVTSCHVAALRTEMQNWLNNLRSIYWVPLQDSARIVFREIFTAKSRSGIGLHLQVESCLGGGNMTIAETTVQTLAAGSVASGKPLGDAGVLYRLLECSSSRAVEVSDLWKNFCDCMASATSVDGKSSQSALKFRFGHGLLALHTMGLISPQAGGKTDNGAGFDHWRLRKRHFGRVWLKGKQSVDDEDISALCAAVPASGSTAADVRLALRSEYIDTKEPKQLPAWAQRYLPEHLRDSKLPSLLKRKAPPRPTGFDPAAKRTSFATSKSRPRIFMA